MGYFSNGTEGALYEESYCENCVHMQEFGCPCWEAHQMWNYEYCNDKDSLLHKMIPRGDHGENLQCIFYVKS